MQEETKQPAEPVEPAPADEGEQSALDALWDSYDPDPDGTEEPVADEAGEQDPLDALWDSYGTEDAAADPTAVGDAVEAGSSGLLDSFFQWAWPFFDWADHTSIGIGIRESLWLFPVIEAFHLVAFAVMGGTILLVDLRLLGLVFRSHPVADLAQSARPWFVGSLLVTMTSGFLLYLSEPIKLYYSNPFWIKMLALALGILVALTIRRKITRIDPVRLGPVWGRLVGAASIVLWATVAWGGRWIGFS